MQYLKNECSQEGRGPEEPAGQGSAVFKPALRFCFRRKTSFGTASPCHFSPAGIARSGSDTPPACHSRPSRRFATPKGRALPKFAIRAKRGLNRSEFLPSRSNNTSNLTRVSFSVFAVLFEAAKAKVLLFSNRVRISRRGASALARDAAGYLGAAAPKRVFFGSFLCPVTKK